MPQATVELTPERSAWNRQLAIGLLEYGKQDTKRELQVVELEPSDPWRPIYAACLGLLPDEPTASVLRELRSTHDQPRPLLAVESLSSIKSNGCRG